jgi:hypothetical protein
MWTDLAGFTSVLTARFVLVFALIWWGLLGAIEAPRFCLVWMVVAGQSGLKS